MRKAPGPRAADKPGSANAERLRSPPRQKSLAVPTLSGKRAARANNPWQCQNWVANARNLWQCQRWVASKPSAPITPGSANAEWLASRKRQKSLTVPTLDGSEASPSGPPARTPYESSSIAMLASSSARLLPALFACPLTLWNSMSANFSFSASSSSQSSLLATGSFLEFFQPFFIHP